jgi:hypothetical protein
MHRVKYTKNDYIQKQYTKKKKKNEKEKRINTFGDVCWFFRSFRQL